MKYIFRFSMGIMVFVYASCATQRNISKKDDGKIEIVFVQVNDVYEIAPLSGGIGGMARVATLKKEWLQKNPNTFLVMAGDFVSPTVYNSLQYQGKAIRGRQMIEAMNEAGMDLAVFGNHEFDIKESELQDRINESKFQWISSNSFHIQNNRIAPFYKTTANGGPIPKTLIMTVRDADGTTAKIGFIGLTLPFNKADYVSYTDPLATAKELYYQLKDSVDAVVAITHQAVNDDSIMVKQIPGLALVLGGHEHDMHILKVANTWITKAHANARSAYVVKLKINKKKGKVSATPKLKYLDEHTPLDSATKLVVEKWMKIADDNYSSLGFDARKVVLTNSEPLDGRETEVRSHPTNLTRLIINAIAHAAPQADVVLFNAGSIRVDDVPMPVTQYDLIRSLPFGGGIREADMKGSLLIKTLDQGHKNKGIGGFLLYNEAINLDSTTKKWTLNNAPIEPGKTYRVAMSDFLFTGREANMDFLNPKNPDIIKAYDAQTAVSSSQSEIRLAIFRYLEK